MTKPSFLERAPIRRALKRWRDHWLERHQHPFSRAIHFLGIPLTLLGVVLLFVLPWEQWYWGVGAFILGYFVQWLGHRVEGNDMGEWAAVKKALGLPYVAVAPRWNATSDTSRDREGAAER